MQPEIYYGSVSERNGEYYFTTLEESLPISAVVRGCNNAMQAMSEPYWDVCVRCRKNGTEISYVKFRKRDKAEYKKMRVEYRPFSEMKLGEYVTKTCNYMNGKMIVLIFNPCLNFMTFQVVADNNATESLCHKEEVREQSRYHHISM